MFYPILITVLILFAFFLITASEMSAPLPPELDDFDPRPEKTSIDQPLAPSHSASLWDLSAEA